MSLHRRFSRGPPPTGLLAFEEVMIYCDSPTLEEWLEPYPDIQPPATWTKLTIDGVLLFNLIELVDWTTDPVEGLICEACPGSGCRMDGLVRLITLPEQVLWVRPYLDDPWHYRGYDEESFWREELEQRIYPGQAIVMPKATWNGLRARFPGLPPADHFPRATRRDLGRLWLREMPEAVRVTDLAGLDDHLRRTALASDPLDLDPAREIIRSMIGWLNEAPGQPVAGRIIRVEEAGCPVNSFYFNGPPFWEWPAFLVGRENGFVFDRGWVLLTGGAND
jgi:hypothetical protein